MIEYDRKNWVKSVFSFRGTALRRASTRILAMTAYAVAVQAVFQAATAYGQVDIMPAVFNLSPTAHAVLG
ncbi:MAG TPA: hypothetical protein VGG64_15910, partial [Pirellulales bacterium]